MRNHSKTVKKLRVRKLPSGGGKKRRVTKKRVIVGGNRTKLNAAPEPPVNYTKFWDRNDKEVKYRRKKGADPSEGPELLTVANVKAIKKGATAWDSLAVDEEDIGDDTGAAGPKTPPLSEHTFEQPTIFSAHTGPAVVYDAGSGDDAGSGSGATTPPSSPPAPAIAQSQDDAMDTAEGADDGCGHLRKKIVSLEHELFTKRQQFQSQDQHLAGLHERLNAQDAELHQYHANNQELQGQLGQYQAYVADLERQVQQGATANPCHRYIEALEEIKNHLEQKGTLTNAEFNNMSNVIFLQTLRM